MLVEVRLILRSVRDALGAVVFALVVCTAMSATAQQGGAVPVTVRSVARQDVPVWLKGLGTGTGLSCSPITTPC